MTVFAVGDIQGCYDPLRRVMDRARFDPEKDMLWAVGDLVNRGPQSLKTLRFLKSLGTSFGTVLGNHDLHLLAIAYTEKKIKRKDTLQEILDAHDRYDLLDWLRFQPLVKYLKHEATLIVHAGLPPFWQITDACRHAREVEDALQSRDSYKDFLSNMYGNESVCWSNELKGNDRLRTITNILTRMRFLDNDQHLNLTYKCKPEEAPKNLTPWFGHPNQLKPKQHIIFGHWATLETICPIKNLHAIDSGCVWGNKITLLELGNWNRLSSN